jgi:hypothetical protein
MDPEDMSGGSGGATPQYPEQWKRERILWFVHEWIQENQAGEDLVPEISVHKIIGWGDEQEGLNGVQAVNLLKQLVEERYISVNFLDTRGDGYPWYRVAPQSLTTKGLVEIGELPNPDERFAAALARARLTIEQEPSIPEDKKHDMLDTMEKMASLANNVAGLGQAIIQNLS